MRCAGLWFGGLRGGTMCGSVISGGGGGDGGKEVDIIDMISATTRHRFK